MKIYTLAQIKKAFWAEFHLAGELWFNYLGTEIENEESTEVFWKGFIEELDKIPPNKAVKPTTNRGGLPIR